MPEPLLALTGTSIVLIGAFNPRIFQPEWFARQSLLPQKEVEAANIQIIHQQVTQFETERFVFQVTDDRLLAATKPNTIAEPLRDLIAGTFYILEHTPVQGIGLNRQMHFKMDSEEAWHKVGDKLVPKEGWAQIVDRRPGMRNLQVLYGSTSPEEPAITATVQPSVQVVPHGVYFEVNYHFNIPKDDGLKFMMAVLNDRWEECQNDAERMAKFILDWAKS